MRLPEVADELRAMAQKLQQPRLAVLAGHIRRRPMVKKAAARSTPMTPELEAAIRDYAKAYPKLSQVEIGRHFKVNQGRVSEALRGKRQ